MSRSGGSDLAALDAALDAVLGSLSGEKLQALTEAAAQPILSDAIARAPVLRGDVHDALGLLSLHSSTSASTVIQVADSGPVGTAHEAVFLEYGTSRMRAKPFLRPAFENNKAEAVAIFERGMANTLSKHT